METTTKDFIVVFALIGHHTMKVPTALVVKRFTAPHVYKQNVLVQRKDEDGLYHICDSCALNSGCEACNDEGITFCTECLPDHLKNCNKSSRAQRIINSETYSIKQEN